MFQLILRRLLQLPIILWLVGTLSFVMALSIPGEPIKFAKDPGPKVRAARRAEFQLDRPLLDQYLLYLHRLGPVKLGELQPTTALEPNSPYEDPLRPDWYQLTDREVSHDPATWPLFHVWIWHSPDRWQLKWPDLHVSIPTGLPVSEILGQALPVSLLLGLFSLSLALLLGTVAGLIGALWRNGWPDYLSLGLVLTGVSLPSFVTGTVLLLMGSVQLKLFPAGGWGTPGHLILPALALALPYAAYIARLMRASMIESLNQDYVRTARAKGVGPSGVVLHHAFRNAFLPVLSFLGPATANILTGSFVVENIFTVPGLGTHFVGAVKNIDYFLMVGTVVIYSSLLVVFNLVTDLAYGVLDPRIRVQ